MTTSNSSRSGSALVTLAVIALVLLAVLALGVYDIRTKNQETSELINSADRAAKAEVLAQSIRTMRGNLSGEIEAFDRLILTGDKLVPLIENIEMIGRDLGLETEIVSVGETAGEGQDEPRVIRIALEARGDWAAALSFLRLVESLPYRVIIDEANFSKENADWRLTMVLALHSFDN